MEPAALPLAAQSLLDFEELFVPLGGAAGALALLGMLLLLPLYVTQRRTVRRLLEWQEREPGAGEPAEPEPAWGRAPAAGTTGSMSAAAQRVTSERPALARIGTAERDAIELERSPFLKRVVERGPRHPLVISLLALLLAGAVFAAAALLLRANDDDAPSDRGVVASEVEVVVLNASTTAGLAGMVADDVAANRFIVAGTSAASDTAMRSIVRYADGFDREGLAVARKLGIQNLLEFDAEAEAAAAGATVVVIVGEDLARGSGAPE